LIESLPFLGVLQPHFLDAALARPREIYKQFKRNQERFPERFMFQLTEEESETMVSQNAIPSNQHLDGALPCVFTEHGVLQLSNVLRSGRAAEMSIQTINVFVKMREMIASHEEIFKQLEEIRNNVTVHDEKLELILRYLSQFEEAKKQQTEQDERPRSGYKSKQKK